MTRIDPDFRHEPKTDNYCVNCQRDVDPSKAIRVTVDWDTWEVTLGGDDLIGPDCAKSIGLGSAKLAQVATPARTLRDVHLQQWLALPVRSV